MASDWNDWRYLLAVLRAGSATNAGRVLKVSHTTITRRIAALEQSLGIALVERRQSGFVLTADAYSLLDHVEAIEAAASAAEQAGIARSRGVAGAVRITADEVYSSDLLTPALRALREEHPDIVIELDVTNAIRDLGKGESDVALRSCTRGQLSGAVGRKLCDDDWAFYCSRDYASAHGMPTDFDELGRHELVGGGGPDMWRAYKSWLERLGLLDRVVIQQTSSAGVISAVRQGVGIAVLPCIVAEADDNLVRCFPPQLDHGRVLWLLTHERVSQVKAVRATVDFLYAHLRRRVVALPGLRT